MGNKISEMDRKKLGIPPAFKQEPDLDAPLDEQTKEILRRFGILVEERDVKDAKSAEQ